MTAAALLLAAFLAQAPAPDRNCRDDQGVDRCAEAEQREMRALYGVEPIERHFADGDEVRRAFYVDGYGRDLVLIEFVRAPGRDPTLRVRFPARKGDPPPPPQQAPVPLAVWNEVIDGSENFDRSFVPIADPATVICMHSWVWTIEASDPPSNANSDRGSVRRKVEDACEDGPGAVYAHALERTALALLPHCAALDREQHRNPASILFACRTLSGDRLAAAEVMNLADAFRRARSADDAVRLEGRFDYRAGIDWNGTRNPSDGSPGRFWVQRMEAEGRHPFYVVSVHGESGNRVRLAGLLQRPLEGPEDAESRYEEAAVEMLWVRAQDRGFRVEKATVGPWRPSPPR